MLTDSERLQQEFDEWWFTDKGAVRAMFIAFSDECELPTEHIHMLGVGGAIGSGKQWGRAVKAWRKVLQTEPEVEVFHTSEFETPEGRLYSVYKDWKKDRLDTFGGGLINALSQNHLGCASVATVNPYDWEAAVQTRPKRLPSSVNAYYFCAKALLEHHKEWLDEYYPGKKVTYYFESGGPHEDGLKRAYKDSVDQQSGEYSHLTREPAFVPKDAHTELQIADKLIYEGTKHSSHFLDPDPPDKHSIDHPELGKIWDVRYPAEQWFLSGLDVDVRWYSREHIAEKLAYWGF